MVSRVYMAIAWEEREKPEVICEGPGEEESMYKAKFYRQNFFS